MSTGLLFWLLMLLWLIFGFFRYRAPERDYRYVGGDLLLFILLLILGWHIFGAPLHNASNGKAVDPEQNRLTHASAGTKGSTIRNI